MKFRSGLGLKKYCLSLFIMAAMLSACLLSTSFAAKIPDPPPDVVKLLPVNGDVKPWEVYKNTIVYAAGDKLTEIYNGGYELYTKNGVVDAVQQMYKQGNNICTVTIHRMDKVDSTKGFMEYWRKSAQKQSTYKSLKIPSDAYVYTADGSANGYLMNDKYFVTVSVYIDGEKGVSVCESFLKDISGKVEKLVKPCKTEKGNAGCDPKAKE